MQSAAAPKPEAALDDVDMEKAVTVTKVAVSDANETRSFSENSIGIAAESGWATALPNPGRDNGEGISGFASRRSRTTPNQSQRLCPNAKSTTSALRATNPSTEAAKRNSENGRDFEGGTGASWSDELAAAHSRIAALEAERTTILDRDVRCRILEDELRRCRERLRECETTAEVLRAQLRIPDGAPVVVGPAECRNQRAPTVDLLMTDDSNFCSYLDE